MSESDTSSREMQEAMDHLRSALSTEETEETNFHVRQALQLLNVD